MCAIPSYNLREFEFDTHAQQRSSYEHRQRLNKEKIKINFEWTFRDACIMFICVGLKISPQKNAWKEDEELWTKGKKN